MDDDGEEGAFDQAQVKQIVNKVRSVLRDARLAPSCFARFCPSVARRRPRRQPRRQPAAGLEGGGAKNYEDASPHAAHLFVTCPAITLSLSRT